MAQMAVWRSSSRQFAEVTEEDYATCRQAIEEASALVEKEKARKRLDMVSTFFDYSEILHRQYRFKEEAFERDAEGDLAAKLAEAQRLVAENRRIRDVVRQHPEWLLGTRETTDGVLAAEDHYSWQLSCEMDDAVKTVLYRLQEQGALDRVSPEQVGPRLRKYFRPHDTVPMEVSLFETHPWWRHYVPMPGSLEGQAARFRTHDRPLTSADTASGREPRGEYVVLETRDLPADGYTLCRVELDVEGAGGTLSVRVQDRSGRSGRSLGQQIIKLSDGEGTARRAFVVEPMHIHPETRARETDVPEGATARVQVHIIWEPEAEGAAMEGMCRLGRVEYRRGK